jgi:hypothetical protein
VLRLLDDPAAFAPGEQLLSLLNQEWFNIN